MSEPNPKSSGLSSQNVSKQFLLSVLLFVLAFAMRPLGPLVLTRALSLADYGRFSLLSSVAMFLSYFLSLGSYHFLFKKLSEPTDQPQHITIKAVTFVVVLWTAVVALAAVLLRRTIGSLIPLHHSLLITAFLVAFLYSQILISAYALYAQRRITVYNLLIALKGAFWLLPLVLAYLFWETCLSLRVVAFIWLLGTFVVAFGGFMLLGIRETATSPLSPRTVWECIGYGLPLMPAVYFSTFVPLLSRYLVSHFLGMSEVGLYSISLTFAQLGFALSVKVSETLAPYFYSRYLESLSGADDHRNQQAKMMSRMIKYSLILTSVCVLYVILAGKELIQLIAGADYAGAATIVPLTMMSTFPQVLVHLVQQPILAKSRTQILGGFYFAAIAIGALFGRILIPLWGLQGAAAVPLFVNTGLLVVLFLTVESERLVDWSAVKFLRIFGSSLLAYLVLQLLSANLRARSAMIDVVFLALAVPAVYIVILLMLGAIGSEEMLMVREVFLRRSPVDVS